MNAPALRRVVSYHLSALALQHPPALPLVPALSLLFVDALILALLAQLTGAPMWNVGAVLAVFVALQFIPRARESLSPAILAPFWLVLPFILLRFIWLRLLHQDIPGYFDYALPDIRVLLRLEFLVAGAVFYSALIFLSQRQGIAYAVRLGALVCLGVMAAEYFEHRSLGATGSDPFAYVQMGIDLFTRGTAAHRFTLFPLIADSKIAWYPIVPVGYHLPFNLDGDAITVWSFGGAIAYGVAYRLAGESALYLVNPIFTVLSAIVTGLLAWELTRAQSRTFRLVTAWTAAAVLATSNEIVNWAGVTMVDTQALVFSTLALYCALRVYRTGKWGWAIGAGLSWGAAYFVRHTQFVIVLGMLPLFLASPFPRLTRLKNLALLGLAAFLMALPDLWYHQIYLGSWLTPESEELSSYGLNSIPNTLAVIGQSAFSGFEFGWLTLFLLAGIFLYARREKISSSALLLWFGAALAVHLPYPALRLRDLIPEFPIFAFYIVYGIAAAIVLLRERQQTWAMVVSALLIFLALETGLMRVWNTLPRINLPPPARFGAMTQPQRGSFDTLSQLTPPNAIIGASLNSGAVELYAHRSAFRPADWSAAELDEFLTVTQDKKYEIYLLEDDASLDHVLNDLRGGYHLERITTLDVPLFGDGQVADAGALWKLTR